MKGIRLSLYEIKRLFCVKRNWLFMFVFTFAPILLCTDYFGLGNSFYGSMSDVFMLGPAKQAVFAGAFAALVMTLLEMSRITKHKMDAIIETITFPATNYLRVTLSIIVVALCCLLASLCIVLPYTALSMGNVFKIQPFLAAWGLIYFGGIVTVIVAASGLYMLTRSFDLIFIVMSVLVIMSYFLHYFSNYLLFWVQTSAISFSDATESYVQIDVIWYTRALWLAVACGIYAIGMTSVRKYGKGLISSILHNSKKVVSPLLAVIMLFTGYHLYRNQPFIDNGPIFKYERSVDPGTGVVVYHTDPASFDLDNSINRGVTFTSGEIDVVVDTDARLISGQAEYTISNPSGKSRDAAFEITPGIEVLEVYENDLRLDFFKNERDNFMSSIYHVKLTSDKSAVLRIIYQGYPKGDNNSQSNYWGITNQFVLIPYFFPQPRGAWDTNFHCTIDLPENLKPFMANTTFVESQSSKAGYKQYTYQSTFRNWLIAGEYIIEELNAGGLDIQFVYLKDRAQVMKDSDAAHTVADVVNFFSDTFGKLNYSGMPMIILELDGSFVSGGWGLGNMSVFGEQMFAGALYKGFEGSNNKEGGSGIGVAVHEIAHQWWGWSPDGVYVTEDAHSPWSAEGLTVYSTYLYMKHRFGEEYAKREFTDAWEKNTKKMLNSFYLTHLEYTEKLSTDDAANIYAPFSSITQYEMMPYLLLKAEALKGGEQTFVAEISKMFRRYQRQELTYNKFLNFMGLSREDMKID